MPSGTPLVVTEVPAAGDGIGIWEPELEKQAILRFLNGNGGLPAKADEPADVIFHVSGSDRRSLWDIKRKNKVDAGHVDEPRRRSLVRHERRQGYSLTPAGEDVAERA